jgi:plastocyanin
MNTLEDWTITFGADMPTDWSDDMRYQISMYCADMIGTDEGEINQDCFDWWVEMINSDDGGGDEHGCPPGLTELQCENFMSCMDENGDIICSMLEFQRNLYNICNDDDSHEFCYYSDEDKGREMFNAAFAYEDGDLSAEDFMELIVDSMFGDDTGMGEEMYVIYDGVEITIGAEDAGEYVIDIDSNCYQIEEDEWECFYPHYVMLMDGDDIVTVKQDYCEWDSEDITDVECTSEIRMDSSEGTYNLITATGCYNEWNETTEEMGDLICDQTGEYNYTMYWAEDMTENRNILGSVDDDSPVMEFDYMDYFDFQENYGFAPVYETYEFNVGPDGFEGEIFSYQYGLEHDCEEDCESGRNMVLWVYEYSFNPDNTIDNLMAVSGHNDYEEDDEYYCCYSMLDLELTEGTYVFVMSGDYTQMISDDYNTLYHDTVISEYDDEGDLEPYSWYEGTLDSNDSRAYFPSNYYDYEDHGDDNGDGDEMWLFMAMIENVTAYQDEDITAEEAANNFIDLMYTADAMGLYDDNDGDDDDGGDDGNDVYWQSYEGGHCEWEGDADGEENAWYCKWEEETEWNTWWYYCENHEDDGWHCTDDFGQSEDYEHSAEGNEWSGSGDDEGGRDECPFSDDELCYEVGPYCDSESPDYDPEYCGAESAHYCLEDGADDEGCAWIGSGCDTGEVPQEICDAFLNFDHDAYHADNDDDDHARLDGIIGVEDPPNNDPDISPTNLVGALSDNEGLPMMYAGQFTLTFEGADASLDMHEFYVPIDDGTWNVEMILLDGYEALSCDGCDSFEVTETGAILSSGAPVTVTFGKAEPEPEPEPEVPGCDVTVGIDSTGYAFDPVELTINVGETVCWQWADTSDAHNVVEINAQYDTEMNVADVSVGFTSGDASNNMDFRHTFTEDDKTHYYVCEPHATMGMVGKITVGEGTPEDPVEEIEESGLPSVGFIVGALVLVGAAGLRRRIH